MVNLENIPAYLKKYRGWCGWKYEERKPRLTKVPYNPLTGTHASVNQPDTFADFDSAMKVADSYDGIGIRVGAEIIAIDLDHCKDGGDSTALGSGNRISLPGYLYRSKSQWNRPENHSVCRKGLQLRQGYLLHQKRKC
ncbi:Uncharacterized conserved protein [uncultured Eubacterium sp.]|nr:Uncharacterized conserved protein [uncultured Eubacterium sp.]